MIRLAEMFKWVDPVFSSKTRLRFVGNCVLIGLALLVSMTFMLFQYQESTVNQIGSWIVSAYKHPYKADQSQAEVWLHEGKIDSVISLLNEDDWKRIQFGDRFYRVKTEMLLKLCERLEMVERYEDLHYWAGVWRKLDGRDVTGRAYWFESMRHMKGREEEGRLGLENAWQRFPGNTSLAKFHAKALVESGDRSGALLVLREVTNRLSSVMAEDWEISYGRHSRDLLPKYWSEVLHQLSRMEWSAVLRAGRALWYESFDSNARRARKLSRGKIKYTLVQNSEGQTKISLQVPANITRLTIHPPGIFKLTVSNIRIVLAGQTYDISPDRTRFYGMVLGRSSFGVTGNSPWIQFDVPDLGERSETQKLNMELEFTVKLKSMKGEFLTPTRSSQ